MLPYLIMRLYSSAQSCKFFDQISKTSLSPSINLQSQVYWNHTLLSAPSSQLIIFSSFSLLRFKKSHHRQLYNQKKMQTKGEALGARQLPTCEVCHLQPTPESVQHLPFIIIEAMLLFYSLKLAAAMFLVSYCFARNGWYCPQCKREVVIDFQVEVIRLGNCMIMLARIKFRIISALIIGYLLFSFITGPRSTPKFHVEKSWRSLANNCGYEAFMENSFRANSIYEEYPKLGEWTVEGIFLKEEPNLERKITRMYIKMDPSQFRSPVTEDIVVYQTDHTSSDYSGRVVGDVVRFTGQWQGREGEGHEFRFIATKIERTDKKADLNRIKLVNAAERFIRVHEEQRGHTKQEKKAQNQK